MDYNYIRLENQIKALMNQNHVPSSSVSKIAESLKNGSLELYIDTIQKRFVFKYVGINNPISIDPLKKEILNVELLNGVDISNLVGGLKNGYGIKLEEISKGVFKISVDETMFATKTELNTVDEKFKDYTTTEDLEANYALKSEVSTVDGKFDDYTTTEDLEANYATKTELNTLDEKFNDYTTTADLEANYAKLTNLDEYAKKTDIAPAASQFEIVNGYPDYFIENDCVSTGDFHDNAIDYKTLLIALPEEIMAKLLQAEDRVDIFRIKLRKNIIYDANGKRYNNFIIYAENGEIKSPVITQNNYQTTCRFYHTSSISPCGIAYDVKLKLNLKEMFINGDISIIYLLSQDSLVAKKPTIKCDIIEAKNALRLHETDLHYFYKPDNYNRAISR